MQSNGHETMGPIRFVHETESIIAETLNGGGMYESGLKRGLHDDSDSDSDDGSRGNMFLPDGSRPKPGKKTKGRVKIKMEFIENKLRRYTTFSKRKTGIMKKAYELSTLTGTQVMLLVASETGHVYTFATRKLQPMITSESGKALIQTCLNSPDPSAIGESQHATDQRMNPTGFEETELSYAVSDDELPTKVAESSGQVSKSGAVQYLSSGSSDASPPSHLVSSLTGQPPDSQVTSVVLPSPPAAHQQQYSSSQALAQQSMASIAASQHQIQQQQQQQQQQQPQLQQQQQQHAVSTFAPVSSASAPAHSLPSLTYCIAPQPVTTTAGATPKSANISMQLPTGGFVLPSAGVQPGTPIAVTPMPQGQQTVYRFPSQTGHMVSIQGIPQMSATGASQPHQFVAQTPQPVPQQAHQQPQQQQQQIKTSSSMQQGQQPVTVVSMGSQPTVMYQTPQGIVYAAPTNMGGLPEGFIVNLPQTPTLTVQPDQQAGGTTQQYITIPVPVTLAGSTQMQMQMPMLTPAPQVDNSATALDLQKEKRRK